jgi:C4-dicarboxylate-specific signal transduction histidine kinase
MTFNNITALYVEDEFDVRDTLSSMIGDMFKEFIVESNGQKGLDTFIANQDKIDIVITDINMPELDGLEMIEKINKIKKVPIIITSAYNDSEFLHKAISLGVSSYVNKPINVKELFEELKLVCEPLLLKQELQTQEERHLKSQLETAKFTAIGQLSAGITHEINTPLTFIKATFEMMQYDLEDLEDSDLKKSLLNDAKTINDGILRMENIISSMKEMAQKSNEKKENTNIYSTLITALILTYNKSKHISDVYINNEKFTPTTDKNKLTFMANVQVQRIEQVWIIIINNAMDELQKYKEFQDRRLDITIENIENDKIRILFKDNAGGIDENIIDHVFEAFKSTKESSGMGVGLNIAQKIIYENDATIRAYNEDDGAVFEIIL